MFFFVSAYGLAPAIFLFTLQGAKDRRGEVVGPCKFEEDQHERFPGSNEADKKVRGHIYVLSAKSYKILQVGLSGQPGALRGVEPEVWRGGDLDLNQNLVDYPTSMHFLTLYIYIASLVFQRCWCLSRPPFGPLSHPTKPSSLKNGPIGKLRLVMLAVTCLFKKKRKRQSGKIGRSRAGPQKGPRAEAVNIIVGIVMQPGDQKQDTSSGQLSSRNNTENKEPMI